MHTFYIALINVYILISILLFPVDFILCISMFKASLHAAAFNKSSGGGGGN